MLRPTIIFSYTLRWLGELGGVFFSLLALLDLSSKCGEFSSSICATPKDEEGPKVLSCVGPVFASLWVIWFDHARIIRNYESTFMILWKNVFYKFGQG